MARGHGHGPTSSVIEVHDEQATIEGGFPTAKLGLSLDRLRAGMRQGFVYGVVERGIGGGTGRPRLMALHPLRNRADQRPADGPARGGGGRRGAAPDQTLGAAARRSERARRRFGLAVPLDRGPVDRPG